MASHHHQTQLSGTALHPLRARDIRHHHTRKGIMKRYLTLGYGGLSYLIFLAAFLYFIGLVLVRGPKNAADLVGGVGIHFLV